MRGLAMRMAGAGAALLALAACGSGGTGGGGGGGGLLAKSGPSKWTRDDACKTLPRQAVAAATGVAVTAAENMTNGAGDTIAATCTYTLAAGTLTLLTRTSGTDLTDTEIAQFKDAGGMMPGGEDVPGVGMKAYWNDKVHQLQVVVDRGHYFNITYGPPFTMPGAPKPAAIDARAVSLALARQLL